MTQSTEHKESVIPENRKLPQITPVFCTTLSYSTITTWNLGDEKVLHNLLLKSEPREYFWKKDMVDRVCADNFFQELLSRSRLGTLARRDGRRCTVSGGILFDQDD
jgi:hypothetical protein